MTTKAMRGIDYIGITVPNLDTASKFFQEAYDAVPLYDNITREQGPRDRCKDLQQKPSWTSLKAHR